MRPQYGPTTFGQNPWKTNQFGSTHHMFKDKSTDSQFSEYKTEDQIILINELDP